MDEDNWRPRIDAVGNVLSSWARRTLSYGGRALVINALALSRVWYVASLIHMPGWVHSELSKLIFKFFWMGRPDLVARVVVTQPTAAGGFSVVDIKSKVFSSLLVQWVRRFSSSPSGWVSFFHIGVLFFLESLLLTFLPALHLFPRISFLLSTVICWWLGRRWTVLFLSAVRLLSLPLRLLIMLVLSLA